MVCIVVLSVRTHEVVKLTVMQASSQVLIMYDEPMLFLLAYHPLYRLFPKYMSFYLI